MPEIRVTPGIGQPRQTVNFEEGQLLGDIIDDTILSAGEGLEVWINGSKVDNPGSHAPAANDAVVVVENVKGNS